MPRYVGRFAPSPTGPLHFGSLVAAVGSFVAARAAGGAWHVRIDDLDPPREVAGAGDRILAQLEAFGLTWDGPVVYQSRRGERYRAILGELRGRGLVYPCRCTRREVRRAGGVYRNLCRDRSFPEPRPHAVRLRADGMEPGFADALQGRFELPAEKAGEDFVVRRKDGLFAYQLAVVVDDLELGATDLVRGADLLETTPRQRHLYRLLDAEPPRYAHLPVVLGADGRKLSKQNRAEPVEPRGGPWVARALAFLGHPPPADLVGANPGELLTWAAAEWREERVPREARPGVDR